MMNALLHTDFYHKSIYLLSTLVFLNELIECDFITCHCHGRS